MKQSTYSESVWMFSRRSQTEIYLILVLPVAEKIDQAAEVNSRKHNVKNCWIISRINSNCRKAAVSDTAGVNRIKNPPAQKQSTAWNKQSKRQATEICHSSNHQL